MTLARTYIIRFRVYIALPVNEKKYCVPWFLQQRLFPRGKKMKIAGQLCIFCKSMLAMSFIQVCFFF